MSDILTFFDFVMDIVFMMPPCDGVEAIQLTRYHAIIVAIGSAGLLIFAITATTKKDALSGSTGTAIVMSLCILGIGFIGLKRMDHDIIKNIFLAGYPPMVIALRCGEGFIFGSKASKFLCWWYSILVVGVLVGAYFALKQVPVETIAYIKGGWAIFGAGVAALLWSLSMAKTALFKSPICIIGIFAVFASTLVYVSVSSFEQSFYRWALPLGILLGIISARFSHQENESRSSDTTEEA